MAEGTRATTAALLGGAGSVQWPDRDESEDNGVHELAAGSRNGGGPAAGRLLAAAVGRADV